MSATLKGQIRARMVAEGNVQGVGYRAFVKQVARRMKIRGRVKNLEDGTVEIYCEADRTLLEEFKARITPRAKESEDPFSLYVENIRLYLEGQEGYIDPGAVFEAFTINYGEEATSAFEKSNLERLEVGSLLLSSLKAETSSFRGESNANFHALDDKYHTVSEVLNSMNRSIERLAESIAKLAEGCIEKKGAK